MAETDERSDPSKLYFASTRIRRSIIASYWIVILCAVPIWWSTTSIERLALPTRRVHHATDATLSLPVHVSIDGTGFDARTIERSLRAEVARRGWEGLDVHAAAAGTQEASYRVLQHAAVSTPTIRGRDILLPHSVSGTSALATIADLIAPPNTLADHRVAKFAPRYRLAFSLLNEDAAEGGSPLSWDVERAIDRHLKPVLERVGALHNFTLESQVRFHAPLAVSPTPLQEGHGLTPEDLTIFINSADWTLSSSVSNDPVLHFVLFVPSASRRPLRILDDQGKVTSSSAFILPQWGGVAIYNPPSSTMTESSHLSPSSLDHAFSTFRYQLLALLGVPALPADVALADPPPSGGISDWQLGALMNRRAAENVRGSRETLQSIVQLVDKIENMPVGEDVRGDVGASLDALDQVWKVDRAGEAHEEATEVLMHASAALGYASRAFFNPGMLALLYFPAEHKYAVYTPLFGPLLAVLGAAAVRELKAWRAERRGARQH